ncbi:hypothetical protein Lal_00045143 [Lupinus albus]|nr:hypothetical protein Lal_00045143 [Lupinus albus]
MYVGVPTVIGAGGVERVIEIELNKDEEAAFQKSAKALLKGFGAPVAQGVAIHSADEAAAAAKQLPGPLYVVKSQIHAGGRGKGKFKELGPDAKGGVRLAKSIDEVVAHAKDMLGNTLVTARRVKPASRSTVSTSKTVQTLPANCIARCW